MGSAKTASAPLRVAIAGLGSIGKVVARRIDKGLEGCELVAASIRNPETARAFLAELKSPVTLMELEDLPEVADVIIEALPASVFDTLAEPVLKAGRTLVVISVGALVSRPHLLDLARAYGGKIVAPTGALIGLDAVKAAKEGTINSVRMVTRKPVKGLEGAPYLVKNNISLENLTEPRKVFEGTARDAVIGFPADVNVVAALGLAGIGADRTMIEIWADPASDRNRPALRSTVIARPSRWKSPTFPRSRIPRRQDHRTQHHRCAQESERRSANRDLTRGSQILLAIGMGGWRVLASHKSQANSSSNPSIIDSENFFQCRC